MDVDAYRAALKGSLLNRAKLPAMMRNAAVVLGNVRTDDDANVLAPALDDAEPLPSLRSGPGVREHVAWARDRLPCA